MLTCGLDHSGIQYEDIEAVMMTLALKVLRLRRHPRFPDDDTKEAFWQHVYEQCDVLVEKIIPILAAHDAQERRLYGIV